MKARWLVSALTYLAIIAGSLVLVDLACGILGIFPPIPKYGDAELGWRSGAQTGRVHTDRCTEYSTGTVATYPRNEDGIRTSRSAPEIQADSGGLKIGVVGDSQTDLCAPNPETHFGVLEATLKARGTPVTVLAYGDGRYSPLQDYLAFRKILVPYRPDVLVMNLYTGNDFYDILRVDDRPHFVAVDSGYRIGAPVWMVYDDPGVRQRSRVLFAAKLLAERTGVRPLFLRVRELYQLAREQGTGLSEVIGYLRELRKASEASLGYPEAFAAQMLNQQVFFRHFPAGRGESLRRLRALMRLAHQENPGVLLMMSPLPSYQLASPRPIDEALRRTLERLGTGAEQAAHEEEALYEELRALAASEGWLFVDNLAALRTYQGTARLYNAFDYHFLPAASAIIGRAQAEMLLGHSAALSTRHAHQPRRSL